jgi:hypothetical protein
MTRRLPRLLRTVSLPRHLSITVIVVAIITAPVRTVPAMGGGASDTVAAGPAGWANDLSPIAASDWSYDRAAHLMERAGFGATPEEIVSRP